MEVDKAKLLKRNTKLDANMKAKEFDLNSQITKLKGELAVEK